MTTENNKLIAEFMGAKILSPNTKYSYIQYPLDVYTYTKGQHKETYKQCLHSKNLEYHSSWNWLMEVVEKIESLYITNRVFIANQTVITIHDKSINDSKVFIGQQQFANLPQNKKENTYNACVEFIKWYNQQK